MAPLTRLTILLTLCATGTADAQPTETWTWKGICSRGTKTANATLITKWGVSGIKSGTLNGRNILSPHFEERDASLTFKAPGIFQDQQILRSFSGTINEDNGELNGKLSQDDGKAAGCKLNFVK